MILNSASDQPVPASSEKADPRRTA
jgi:hypothetical protein